MPRRTRQVLENGGGLVKTSNFKDLFHSFHKKCVIPGLVLVHSVAALYKS